MDYRLEDFKDLASVEAKIHELSESKYRLYREMESMNRSGRRILFASFEEAYRSDPLVRKIYILAEEIDVLWKIARMRCAGGGRFVTTRR